MCRVLDRENARWDEGNREKSWMNGKRKIRREEPGWSGLAAEERLARAKKSGGRGKFRWPKRKAWIPLPPALATLSPSARPSPKHQPPSGLRGSMSATLLLATVAPHNCKSCACYDARLVRRMTLSLEWMLRKQRGPLPGYDHQRSKFR